MRYLQKLKKTQFLHTLRNYGFIFLLINQDLSKIKNPKHYFVENVKWETGAKFQRKLLNSMVVGARQGFQFFRQITWFLRNNRVLIRF